MTKAKNPNVQRTVVILLCIIVLFVGAMVSRILRTPESIDEMSPPQVQSVTAIQQTLQQSGVFVRPQPRVLDDFTLSDEQGQPFSNDRFEGQWNLVFLGFTHCPEICPTTLALFKTLHESWQASDLSTMQYVLLSADPERDTSARLAEYLDNFHSDFVGLTGTIADVDRLAKQLNGLFAKMQMDEGYMMDHSTNIMIINPAGQYHGFIRPPHSVEQIQAAMQAISSSY